MIDDYIVGYTDEIDIYAGCLTKLVAWWAIRFYKHRQKNWHCNLELKSFLFLFNLQAVLVRSSAYHLFEYSAQMMWIFETQFVSNFADGLVVFRQ